MVVSFRLRLFMLPGYLAKVISFYQSRIAPVTKQFRIQNLSTAREPKL